MIVRCNKIISSATNEDLGNESPWLKKGKEYIVLALTCDSAHGINLLIQTENFNDPMFSPILGFEIISNKLPSSWITDVKNIDDILYLTMHPKSWSYEGFYEELEDETPKAVALFNKEAELIYADEGLVMPASRRLV